MRPRLSIATEHQHYTGHIIASYSCLQGLIGLANFFPAISCYKFHISKDQQENIKPTIICYLTAFLSVTIYIEKVAK